MKRIALAILCLSGACGGRSVMLHRPESKPIDDAITEHWVEQIQANAEPGDWLVSRSYSFIGDTITVLTTGGEWSHGAIYDADTGTVIEVQSEGVIEVPLEKFVRRNYHLAIVRPAGLSARERRASLERARSKLGVKYDFTGLFGVDDPDRFYCTELLVWAIEAEDRGLDTPLIISPSDLFDYGDTVFYTGTRDEPEVQWRAQTAHRIATGEERTRVALLAASR